MRLFYIPTLRLFAFFANRFYAVSYTDQKSSEAARILFVSFIMPRVTDTEVTPHWTNFFVNLRMGLVNLGIVEDLVACGAVGEIASHWWFNSNGNIVNQEQTHAIGLGLDGLTDALKS